MTSHSRAPIRRIVEIPRPLENDLLFVDHSPRPTERRIVIRREQSPIGRIPGPRAGETQFRKPLLSFAVRIVTKEGPKVKRWPSGLTGAISGAIIRRSFQEANQ